MVVSCTSSCSQQAQSHSTQSVLPSLGKQPTLLQLHQVAAAGRHCMVWMWSEPVISPSSAQPGLKIFQSGLMVVVLQSPLCRWKWLVPARMPGEAAAPLPLHWHRILGSCAAEISIGERCQGQTMAQSVPARHRITARDVLVRADSSIGFVPPGCMGLSRVGKRGTEFHGPLP